ncbi:flagellum-specific ATP synthase FliI, partial [Rhodobacter sphaeroides]|nr:flagellum-specific ATP synthase FliI [Cereibacter sphaeroides]
MSGEFDGLLAEIAAISLSRRYGRVTGIGRGTLSVGGLEQGTALGDRVEICGAGGILGGEVLRLSSHEVTILPDGSPEGLAIGDAVALVGPAEIAPDDSWIGRIVDPLGRPLDGRPLFRGPRARPLRAAAPQAAARPPPPPP